MRYDALFAIGLLFMNCLSQNYNGLFVIEQYAQYN
jgi:hypothetical protein